MHDRSTIRPERECGECGKTVGGKMVFCPWCGVKLPEVETEIQFLEFNGFISKRVMCCDCGHAILSSYRFCDKCGAQIRKKPYSSS